MDLDGVILQDLVEALKRVMVARDYLSHGEVLRGITEMNKATEWLQWMIAYEGADEEEDPDGLPPDVTKKLS